MSCILGRDDRQVNTRPRREVHAVQGGWRRGDDAGWRGLDARGAYVERVVHTSRRLFSARQLTGMRPLSTNPSNKGR